MNKAIKIIQTLNEHGFSAYFAGGCVRDMLMGLEPHDIDIATSATPDEVEKVFPRTIPVGKQFGVIVVLIGDEQFEVATFRTDGNYTDGRRPEGVTFSTPEEDAKRRDLTINGMFFNPLTNEVLDFVGGKEDIKNRTIRFIGNSHERIEEDRLRMLRAVRFGCKFGFDFNVDSLMLIEYNAHRILDVSKERIKSELDKMLVLEKPSRAIKILHNIGILKYILPEVESLWGCEQSPNWHSEGDVFVHTMMVLDNTRKMTDDLVTLWAALLHDIGKPATSVRKEDGNISCHGHDKLGAEMALELMIRLKFSNEEKELITSIVRDHMRVGSVDIMKKSTIRKLVAQKHFDSLLKVFEADCISSIPAKKSIEDMKLKGVMFIKDFISNPDNVRVLPKPFITGSHLIKLGMKPGPLFKEILNVIMDKQLEGEITSEEEGLSEVASLLLKEGV
jgi:poly(A) polymerase